MHLPAWFVLLVVLALVLAVAYQLVTHRYGWRIIAYWIVVFAGLLGFELAAETLGLNFTRLGDLRLLPDLMGAGLALSLLWFMGV